MGLQLEQPEIQIANIAAFAIITVIVLYIHWFAGQFDSLKFQGKKGFRRREDKNREKHPLIKKLKK